MELGEGTNLTQRSGGDILGLLHFYNAPEDGSLPYFHVTDTCGAGRKNYGHDPRAVLIRDIRNKENGFSLQIHSFAAVTVQCARYSTDADEDELCHRHASEAQQILLKNVEGAREIVVFDTTLRKAFKDEVLRRPVRKVHIDQTPLGVLHRIKRHLSAHHAKGMLAGRLRIRLINVWRPVVEIVEDHHLVMAESATVDDQDLVKVRHEYTGREGETYAVRYNGQQRFWYWSQISWDEALLLQCFDSQQRFEEGHIQQSSRCAHASFNPLAVQTLDCKRRSIETRCIVIG
ncbi:MAG: hypothetical protein LQ344_004164 [Seirophora lacunosa]|nr:MAG: hypothetical protein LQ344_004164 [Seirophora lacunosa]